MTSQADCGVFMAEDFSDIYHAVFKENDITNIENNITKIYKVYDAYFHHLYGWKWYNKKHVINVTFQIQKCYKDLFLSAVKKNDFFKSCWKNDKLLYYKKCDKHMIYYGYIIVIFIKWL